MLHTSSADQPSESRRVTTSRWLGGSESIAAWIRLRASPDSSRSSGAAPQPGGNDVQCPGHLGASAGRKRPGSTAGSNESVVVGSHKADKGMVRFSRTARVLAVFTRIWKIQVLRRERASNRS